MSPISLQELPLFASLSPEDAEKLFAAAQLRQLPAGAVLCHEGEYGDRFYIVLEGEVEILKALPMRGNDDSERLLKLLGPGDFVGEMSLFDRKSLRTATLRAHTALQVLEVTHTALDALLRQYPILAYEVVRELSLRLQDAGNAVIRDLQEKNWQLEQAYQDLKSAQAQIIEKERLERELQVARHIQESILPQALPSLAGFEFGARMLPARAVGGDFYDVIPLAEGRVGLAVGDVSDKGVPAAIFMALTRSLLRAEATPRSAPARVLQKVNRHLLDMNDAGMFVSVLYGVLDGKSRQFTYARAGHEMPLGVNGAGELMSLPRSCGQPLGVLEHPLLDVQMMALPPGSTLLLFTDGAPDAIDAQGCLFDHLRLGELLRARRTLPAQAVCEGIVAALAEYQGLAPQHDDITLLAIRAGEG